MEVLIRVLYYKDLLKYYITIWRENSENSLFYPKKKKKNAKVYLFRKFIIKFV